MASLIIAVAQTGYAFAPAFFGLIREFTANGADMAPGAAPALFAAAAVIQALAIAAFLAGTQVMNIQQERTEATESYRCFLCAC